LDPVGVDTIVSVSLAMKDPDSELEIEAEEVDDGVAEIREELDTEFEILAVPSRERDP
jgi:hypothetical protein